MAIHLSSECSVARTMAGRHDAALLIYTAVIRASSRISIFSSVFCCRLCTWLHRIQAHWQFDHASCSSRHGGRLASCPARGKHCWRIFSSSWPPPRHSGHLPYAIAAHWQAISMPVPFQLLRWPSDSYCGLIVGSPWPCSSNGLWMARWPRFAMPSTPALSLCMLHYR